MCLNGGAAADRMSSPPRHKPAPVWLQRPPTTATEVKLMAASVAAERLQKVLSQLGLGSRREAEDWIRAGRLTVNGKPAVLGMRVGTDDQLKLDGRTIRRGHAATESPVFLCHRSPGEPLLPARSNAIEAGAGVSMAERLPRRAGRRFISVSPMPLSSRTDGNTYCGPPILRADQKTCTAQNEQKKRKDHRIS